MQKTLYEQDFNLWLITTVKQLKQQELEKLDIPHLIEELEAMGGNNKRELTSRLTTISEHLLKLGFWESQREYNQRGWRVTIRTQRIELFKLLKQSPSLKSYLQENYSDCLANAIAIFYEESGIKLTLQDIDFDLSQVIDSNWFFD